MPSQDVRLSHACILSKSLNIGLSSNFFHRWVATPFPYQKVWQYIVRGPQRGRRGYKYRNFRPISRFISEMIQESYTYNGQAIESRIRTAPFSLILSDLAKYSLIRSIARSLTTLTVLPSTPHVQSRYSRAHHGPPPLCHNNFAKQYIGAYTEPAHKNPDKIRISGFDVKK